MPLYNEEETLRPPKKQPRTLALEEIIRSLYQVYLKRDPQINEVRPWIHVYEKKGLLPLIKEIECSLEATEIFYKNHQADLIVESVYRELLGRSPDPAGAEGWKMTIAKQGLSPLLRGVLDSDEFLKRYRKKRFKSSVLQIIERLQGFALRFHYNPISDFFVKLKYRGIHNAAQWQNMSWVFIKKSGKTQKAVLARLMALKRKIVPAKDFFEQRNLVLKEICPALNSEISPPVVFGLSNKELKEEFLLCENAKAIYVARCEHALVHGGTSFLFSQNNLIHHDNFHAKNHSTSEELHGRLIIYPKLAKARWLMGPGIKQIPVGAPFLDSCAYNYAHWISEILPRISLFCDLNEFKNTPIVINKHLPSSIKDSLLATTGNRRRIIEVNQDQAIYIKKCYYVSTTGAIPWGVRSTPCRDRHGNFHPLALKKLKEKLVDWAGVSAEKDLKIFVARTSLHRNMKGQQQLIEELINMGFTQFAPEKYSLQEQIRVFARATHVVGVTGAAMVNALFCPRGATVQVVLPRHVDMPYFYWHQILSHQGIKVVNHVCQKTQSKNMHDDYELDDDVSQRIVELV